MLFAQLLVCHLSFFFILNCSHCSFFLDSYVVLKLSSSDPKQLLSRVHQTIGATPVIPKTVNPVWNQKCHLPILHSSSKLIFEVWKANRVRGDRILGFTTFECDKLPFPSKGVHHFHLPLTAPKLSASKDHVSHLVREVSGTLSITLDYSAVRAAVMPRSDPVIRIPESDHLCHTPRSTTAGPLPTPPE
ncbi:MAG: C2 domain-containing protein [archaeon]|nr:C2 domain-containing protein [archaeon]